MIDFEVFDDAPDLTEWVNKNLKDCHGVALDRIISITNRKGKLILFYKKY